jgi:phage shock protein PspC (stress-responsive transcriptional regulator)
MTETPGSSATDQQQPPPAVDPPPPVDPHRRPGLADLRRSVSDRKLAGVAGGLGRHLGIDPTIVRVVLVVMCFFGGSGFLAYGVAWLLVPEDGRDQGVVTLRDATRNALLIGTAVVAGLLLIGDGWGGIDFPWPALIVGSGVLLYVALRDHRSDRTPLARPAPGSTPPWDQQSTPPAPAWSTQPMTQPAPALATRPRKRGPLLFGYTLALVAIALGSLGLYDASGGAVVPTAYPALALAVVGLMLVLGAFVGRAGGLVLLGILAAGALALTSLVGALGGWHGTEGERIVATPRQASAVRDSYYVPNGRIVLDLSAVRDPAALAGRSIEVGGRAGELVIVLPTGVTTHLASEITGPGQIDSVGRLTAGIGSVSSQTVGRGAGTFSVRAHLFAGHIDVRTS